MDKKVAEESVTLYQQIVRLTLRSFRLRASVIGDRSIPVEKVHENLKLLTDAFKSEHGQDFGINRQAIPIKPFWKDHLVIGACIEFFAKLEEYPLSGSKPGGIKAGVAFLFENKPENRGFWRLDGLQYREMTNRPFPHRKKDDAQFWEKKYQLKHDGKLVNFYRNEYYFIAPDGKRPLEDYVLVYYRGDFDPAVSKQVPHGNLGKRKATAVLLKYSPGKQGGISQPLTPVKPMMLTPTKRNPPKPSPKQLIPSPKRTRPYFATPKGVLAKVDAQVKKDISTPARKIHRALEFESLEDPDELWQDEEPLLPRNYRQIENRKQKQLKIIAPYNNDLGDVLSFARINPDVLRYFYLSPGTAIFVSNPGLIKHVDALVKITPITLYYDTTYNVGKFFVSTLTLRHPLLENMPLLPIAFHLHEFTDMKSAHKPFFEEFRYILPRINRPGIPNAIVTDREKSIKDSIAKQLPGVLNFFCFSHIFKNIRRFCKGKFSPSEVKGFIRDIKKILWSETIGEFERNCQLFIPQDSLVKGEEEKDVDELGNTICEDDDDLEESGNEDEDMETRNPWPTRFANYFMRYLKQDLLKTAKLRTVTYSGVFSSRSGVTNNAAESVNSALKKRVSRGSTFFSAVAAIYNWTMEVVIDLYRAQKKHGGGNYTITDEALWSKIDILEPKEFYLDTQKFEREVVILDGRKFSMDVNRKAKEGLALKALPGVFLQDKGNFIVLDGEKHYQVNFPTQRCSCPNKWCHHILAVNMKLGVHDQPNFSNLEHAKPPTFTDVHSKVLHTATGKKGPPRIPVVYEPAIEGPSDEFPEPVLVSLPDATTANAGIVLLSIGDISVTLNDLKTVQADIDACEVQQLQQHDVKFVVGWLSDSIIDAFLKEILPKSFRPVSSILSGILITGSPTHSEYALLDERNPLIQGSPQHKRKSWKAKFVVFPCNLTDDHWIVVIADTSKQMLICYDPMNCDFVLEANYCARLHAFLNSAYKFQTDQQWVTVPGNGIRQSDSINCGPLVLAFVERFAKGIAVDRDLNVYQYRHHILNRLVRFCDLQKKLEIHSEINQLCAICIKEDIPKGLDANAEMSWVQCGRCKVWIHRKCDKSLEKTPTRAQQFFCSAKD